MRRGTESYDRLIAILNSLVNNQPQLIKMFDERSEALKRYFGQSHDRIGDGVDTLCALRIEMADTVPHRPLEEALNALSELNNLVLTILRFSSDAFSQQGWKPEAENLLQQLDSRLNQSHTRLAPVLSFHASSLSSSRTDAIVADLEQASIRVKQSEAQVKQALNAVQAATSQIGFAQQAQVFLDESRQYRSDFVKWMWAFGTTVVLGIIGLLVFIANFEPRPDPTGNYKFYSVVSFVGVKLLLVTIFLMLLTIILRNLFAAKHNAIINKHRACTMQSFELFVQGKGDDSTKNAIRRVAAESIFAIQRTGMLGKDSGVGSPINVSALTIPDKQPH